MSRSEKRETGKKADAGARKCRTDALHCVFPMICGSGAKAAGAEPSGQMRDEKLHAVVARSTFSSQNVQSTPFSDHFWKLSCRKSACRCGAKHIFKSKCTKHTILGPLLEVELSKKCTPLWREAYFQVCTKHTILGPLLEVEMLKKCPPLWPQAHFQVKMYKVEMSRKCTPLWREAHVEVKSSKLTGSDHFWTFRCRFAWQARGPCTL